MRNKDTFIFIGIKQKNMSCSIYYFKKLTIFLLTDHNWQLVGAGH